MKNIDYYFWINSDWAYLGADRLEALAARNGASIAYKPVDLLAVYARTGGIPLGERSPERQAYRQQELKRWSERLGIAINVTPRHMCPNGDLASCLTIAADHNGLGVAELYKAILHAQWCDDLDVSDPDVLLKVVHQLGYPGENLLTQARTEAIKKIYLGYTEEAIASGVFGSPTYCYRDGIFWGQDRLDFLEEAIAQD